MVFLTFYKYIIQQYFTVTAPQVGTSPVLFSSPVSVSVIREFKIHVLEITCTAKSISIRRRSRMSFLV